MSWGVWTFLLGRIVLSTSAFTIANNLQISFGSGAVYFSAALAPPVPEVKTLVGAALRAAYEDDSKASCMKLHHIVSVDPNGGSNAFRGVALPPMEERRIPTPMQEKVATPEASS